jgi:hypothetical protein
MDKEIFDLYSDYLLSSFSYTTATGLSRLMGGSLSHDRITRFLSDKTYTPAELWVLVKPMVRQVQSPDAVLIFDDSIEEKPYTDENEIICWHWDHSKNISVKGINFMTGLYYSNNVSLPVTFQLISKTETVIDKKTGKNRRKSKMTKNEYYRQMVADCVHNQLEFTYVLNDSWYASAENMVFIKNDMNKHFVMPLKGNRKVALTAEDKKQGLYVRVNTVLPEPDQIMKIYLEGVGFPLLLARQVFTNEDGSTAVLYLVTSDMTLGYEDIITLYQKRWKVEEYHKSLKQNVSLCKSPTRTVVTQTNHFFAALYAFIKLEALSIKTSLNHFALKSKIYASSLKIAFQELQKLQVAYDTA